MNALQDGQTEIRSRQKKVLNTSVKLSARMVQHCAGPRGQHGGIAHDKFKILVMPCRSMKAIF